MTGPRAWPAVAPAAAVLGLGPALAAGLALVPLAGQRQWLEPLGALAGAGVLLYVAALAIPWPGVLPWALGLLAVEYLVGLELTAAPLDARAPAYGAGLLLCAELGWLGLEARRGGRPWLGRALAIGLLVLAGATAGSLLLLVAATPLPGGAGLTALGVAAAVAIAACLAWLARR